MLDDFKESQFIAYSLLNNAIIHNKLSHAYLFDANYYDGAFDFVLSFIKSILCPEYNVESKSCSGCNLCKRIQNNNYPEIKIIESDSAIIKKEQLLELQSEFSRSSIEGDYRIYIIKDCDKMNKQASNCLLKFLEEPVPGIIAILLTNQFNKLLSTIVSRCQVIRLNNLTVLNNKKDRILFLEDESKVILIDTVLSFINYLEENGLDTLIYMKSLWYNKIITREDAGLALLLMLYFYYDTLNYKVEREQYFFCDKIEFVKKIAQSNSIESILYKIDVLNYGYEMVFNNLNINLLMDDIVIRLGDVV